MARRSSAASRMCPAVTAMPAGKPDRSRTAHRSCSLPGPRRARDTRGHCRRTHRCTPMYGHMHRQRGPVGGLDRTYLRSTPHRRRLGDHSARRRTPGRTSTDRRRQRDPGTASSMGQEPPERRAWSGRSPRPPARHHTASRPRHQSRAVPPSGRGPGCSRADGESSRRTPRPIQTARSARAVYTSPPALPVRSPRGEPTDRYTLERSRSRRSTPQRQVLRREHGRNVPEAP
jgi:hypothetical protein